MNIDLASIDMVSEVNMVSAALSRAVPDPWPALRAHSVHSAGPEAFSAGPAALRGTGLPLARLPAPAGRVRGASWASRPCRGRTLPAEGKGPGLA